MKNKRKPKPRPVPEQGLLEIVRLPWWYDIPPVPRLCPGI